MSYALNKVRREVVLDLERAPLLDGFGESEGHRDPARAGRCTLGTWREVVVGAVPSDAERVRWTSITLFWFPNNTIP